MAQVAWTAIGLLAATLFGNVFWLGSRIDNLAARMDSGFAHIDARLDEMNSRIDGLNARLDSHLQGRRGHG